MNKKNGRAIVFGLTSNHTFALACVLMDIKRICPRIADEIVVFHDGIKEKDMEIIKKIFPTKFFYYEMPISNSLISNTPAVNQFTKMVFTKFECLRLLEEYKSVMWLDYDIVIQKDFSELFEFDEKGIKLMLSGMPVSEQFHQPVPNYDMAAEAIGAGIFVLQDHLDSYMRMYEYCYSKLEEYASILRMPEQAIFELMIQDFKIKSSNIDRNIYSAHPKDFFAESAKIIHSYGQPKFWNGLENKQWEKNYAAWIKSGGSINKKRIFSKKISNIINILKRIVKF